MAQNRSDDRSRIYTVDLTSNLTEFIQARNAVVDAFAGTGAPLFATSNRRIYDKLREDLTSYIGDIRTYTTWNRVRREAHIKMINDIDETLSYLRRLEEATNTLPQWTIWFNLISVLRNAFYNLRLKLIVSIPDDWHQNYQSDVNATTVKQIPKITGIV